MKILFSIGSLPVTLYGCMTALALLCFWAVGCLILIKKQKDADTLRWVLLTGVLGWFMSRLVFVLCDAGYYIDELNGYWAPALCFWDGGYSMVGAILGAVLGAWLCGKKQRTASLNAVGVAMPLSAAILRLAEFLCDTEASGDIGEGNYLEGGPLDALFQKLGLVMQADSDLVYPACLAGFAAMVLLFIFLLIWSSKARIHSSDVLSVSLLLYGTIMVVLEQLRNDGHLIFHFVHLQQVLAVGLMLQAPIRWTIRARRQGTPKKTLILLWVLCLVLMGLAFWACFGVDRWENKTLAWTVLTLPTMGVAAASLWLRRRSMQ